MSSVTGGRSFDDDAASALCEEIAGAPVVPSLARRVAPLGDRDAVVAAMRGWRAQGALRTTGGYIHVAPGTEFPDPVYAIARARLAACAPDARRMVATLSLLGRAASFDELRAIAGPSTEGARATLALLEDAGIIECADAYTLARSIDGTVCVRSMTSTQRAELHAEIYRALHLRSARGAHVTNEELARHAREAGYATRDEPRSDPPSPAGDVERLVTAGRWDDVVAILDATPADAGPLRIGAHIRAYRGDFAGAIDDGLRAVELDDSASSHAALAVALIEAGAPAEAIIHASPRERAQASLALKDHRRAHEAIANEPFDAETARIECEIALARGDKDDAISILEPWIDVKGLFDRARVLHLSATLLVSKDKTLACERARDALAIYAQLGAVPRLRQIEGWLLKANAKRGRPRSETLLTPRESEILRHVRVGLTDREIAARLFVSVATVRKHLETAKRKLGVSRRVELALARVVAD